MVGVLFDQNLEKLLPKARNRAWRRLFHLGLLAAIALAILLPEPNAQPVQAASCVASASGKSTGQQGWD